MSTANPAFIEALEVVGREKGVSVDVLLDALANALLTAYKRMPGSAEEGVVEIDKVSGEIRVIGQELDDDGNVIREYDDTPSDFGRIAAQKAKQVIFQSIQDFVRDQSYKDYAGREGDIVTGIVQQNEGRFTMLDLGKVEALLPRAEQVGHENYKNGDRMKAYIVEVRKTAKGPQIIVSRTHPALLKRLFQLEVPEIESGTVEIKAIAREPGYRTKMAVWSNDPNVDPAGACIGARGARVRMVSNELHGEKIDIVYYREDPVDYVREAMAPAKPKDVILDDETGTATVVVNEFSLSSAIGKEGQNARLAARLTGWRIDIKSEEQLEAEANGDYGDDVEWAAGEWVEDESGEMVWKPADEEDAIYSDEPAAEGSTTDEAAADESSTDAEESADTDVSAEVEAPADAVDTPADAEEVPEAQR